MATVNALAAALLLVLTILPGSFVAQEVQGVPFRYEEGSFDHGSEILKEVATLKKIIAGLAGRDLSKDELRTMEILIANNTELIQKVAILESEVAAKGNEMTTGRTRHEQKMERLTTEHALALDNCHLMVQVAQLKAKTTQEELDKLQAKQGGDSSRSELEGLRKKYNELVMINARLLDRHSNPTHEPNEITLGYCRERNEELKNISQDLRVKNDQLAVDVLALKSSNEQLERTNADLEEQAISNAEERQEREQELQDRITELNANLTKTLSSYEPLRDQVEALQNQNSEARTELVATTVQLEAAKAGQLRAQQQLSLVIGEFRKFKKSCYRIVYWG